MGRSRSQRAKRGRGVITLLGAAGLILTPLVGDAAGAQQSPQVNPTFRLMHPSDAEQVSLSPSGTHLAALTVTPTERGLLVLEWRGSTLAPILATRLGMHRSFTGYRWLGDNYLLLDFIDYNQNVQQEVLVDVIKRSVHYLSQFVTVVKAPWGDANHVLLSSGAQKDCVSNTAGRCLAVLDLSGGSSARLSDSLPVLPVRYLALSPTEIYATQRDANGRNHDYQLDTVRRTWRPVEEGTFRHQSELARPRRQPTTAELNALARAGIHHGAPVLTEPGARAVGVVGFAPDRAFVAIDSRLDGLETFLQTQYPDARVSFSDLNDELTQGLVTLWDTDQPQRYLMLTGHGLTELGPFAPVIDAAHLGRTHIERDWVSGVPVSVTLPPEGVPLIGAVVEPYSAAASSFEEPLHTYAPDLNAFADRGIATVRLLASMPDTFPDPAAGAAWRATLATELQTVVERVSTMLMPGKPVCLYGARTDGELALAIGALAHVGCTVAVSPMLNTHGNTGSTQVQSAPDSGVIYSLGSQETQRDIPAVFGTAGGTLATGTSWVDRQPLKVMLAYNMRDMLITSYAADSGAFRAAAARAGHSLSYYAPPARNMSDIEYQQQLLDAVADYLQGFFNGTNGSGNGNGN